MVSRLGKHHCLHNLKRASRAYRGTSDLQIPAIDPVNCSLCDNAVVNDANVCGVSLVSISYIALTNTAASGCTRSTPGTFCPIVNTLLSFLFATNGGYVLSPLSTIGGSQRERSVGSGCVIHKERGLRTDVVLFILVQRVSGPGTFRLVLIRGEPREPPLQLGIFG